MNLKCSKHICAFISVFTVIRVIRVIRVNRVTVVSRPLAFDH